MVIEYILRKFGMNIPDGPIEFVDSTRQSDLPYYRSDVILESKIGEGVDKNFEKIVRVEKV